jgi:hypothetical protein
MLAGAEFAVELAVGWQSWGRNGLLPRAVVLCRALPLAFMQGLIEFVPCNVGFPSSSVSVTLKSLEMIRRTVSDGTTQT